MVISDNGASAEGGPTGTTNEAQFFNNAQEPIEESLKLIDEIGGPKHFNHYPWGWTWAGNTPFRRWKRETYRGGVSDPFIVSWPKGIKTKGEVRTQYAHIIDMVPTVLDVLGHRAADRDQRRHAVADARRQLRAHASTTPKADDSHHTQYFEMLGHRAIYHDGWRAVCPWPGPSFTEAGMGFGEPISPRRSPSSTRRLGAVPRRRGLRGEPQRGRREPGQVDRDDRHLVCRGGQVQRDADRRQRPRPDGRREAADRPAAGQLHLPAGHAVGPELRGAEGAEPPAQHHRRRRDPRAGAPRACCSARAPPRAATRSSSRTASCATSTTTSAASSSRSNPKTSSRRAGTSSGSSSSRPGRQTCSAGKGAPGRLQLYVDGTLVGNAEAQITTPFMFNPGALTCGANPGSPVTPEYEGPFSFTGTLHSVTLDVSGELIQDPEAELRAHLARQ